MHNRRAAMAFILITLFLDVLGIGIVIPILPELIKEFMGGDASSAASYYGPLIAAYALMQFLFAPVLGALSDRFGRRPLILIALFGLGVDYLIQGFAPTIGWLFIGRILAGVMGASITTAHAYIADISTPENRSRNFGLVGAAFGIGFIIGPALGGVLGGLWIRLPFFVAAALALLNLIYGLLILPESLKPERRDSFSWAKANPVSSIVALRDFPLVAGLAASFMLVSLAYRGLESVWVLYTGFRFGWAELANGLTLGLVGVMAVVVQGFLIQPTIARFGERRAILIGVAISAISLLLYGLAFQAWMILVVIVAAAPSQIAGPAIQGLVVGSVPSDQQGKVQGALTSLISLTSIGAPLLFTTILFSYFTSGVAPVTLPGAPFYLGSVLIFAALLLLVRLFRHRPSAEPMVTG